MPRNHNPDYTHGGGWRMGYDNGQAISRLIHADHPTIRKFTYPGTDCIDVWAARDQDRPAGKSPKATCWFNGDTLYSYKTPIAKFYTRASQAPGLGAKASEQHNVSKGDGRGLRPSPSEQHNEIITLITDQKYSRTTTAQVWRAKWLTKNTTRIYVPDVTSPEKSAEQIISDFWTAHQTMCNSKLKLAARYAAAQKMCDLRDAMMQLHAAGLVADVFTGSYDAWVAATGVMDEFHKHQRELARRRAERDRLASETPEYQIAYAAVQRAEASAKRRAERIQKRSNDGVTTTNP